MAGPRVRGVRGGRRYWGSPAAARVVWRATQCTRAHRGRQGGPGGMAGTKLHGGNGIGMASACSIRVRGVVQGVGFRPFVYRLARANTLTGWVLNGEEGVEIHLEGAEPSLDAFVRDLKVQAPPAANIAEIEIEPAEPAGLQDFTIRSSERRE